MQGVSSATRGRRHLPCLVCPFQAPDLPEKEASCRFHTQIMCQRISFRLSPRQGRHPTGSSCCASFLLPRGLTVGAKCLTSFLSDVCSLLLGHALVRQRAHATVVVCVVCLGSRICYCYVFMFVPPIVSCCDCRDTCIGKRILVALCGVNFETLHL